MDCEPDAPKTVRHKCSSCYKQYKKKEHLIEHMRVQYHSVHEPMCGVCKKHCKSFESLREHLTGPLPRAECARIFTARGCSLCLNIFDFPDARNVHQETCRLLPADSFEIVAEISPMNMDIETSRGELIGLELAPDAIHGPEAVALDCEMVGGGSDGSLDLCARVCIIDEDESVLFHSYVIPQIPITNYRYEVTGITEEHLKDAMPLKHVQEKIREILYNGEALWRIRLEGGRARILVGHSLDHDLACLEMNYPDHLLRDTSKYLPLMKTNKISHSLKYLTRTYLGYEIQCGVHDPYEDCVAVMRLYKRMRSQAHQIEQSNWTNKSCIFDAWKQKLDSMTPDALFEISRSNYRCWCLDSRQVFGS